MFVKYNFILLCGIVINGTSACCGFHSRFPPPPPFSLLLSSGSCARAFSSAWVSYCIVLWISGGGLQKISHSFWGSTPIRTTPYFRSILTRSEDVDAFLTHVFILFCFSLWFGFLTLREGRNGGQHVPGRRYVRLYFWINASHNMASAVRPVWKARVRLGGIPATSGSLINS